MFKSITVKLLAEKSYKDVGLVQFRDSSRAKVINITVKPFTAVQVSVPQAISVKEAESVLIDNKPWILKEQRKMLQVENKFTVFKVGITYYIKNRPIRIIFTSGQPGVKKMKNRTDIMVNAENDFQNYVRELYVEEMRMYCQENITPVVDQLSSRHHIKIGKASFRNTTTRWGSLGKNNNLNLSLYLASLPDHLIKYVILHELAHVKVKDHSKRYCNHLSSMVPEPKKVEKELKQYSIGVI